MEFITRNYVEIIAFIFIVATIKAILIVNEIVKEDRKLKRQKNKTV